MQKRLMKVFESLKIIHWKLQLIHLNGIFGVALYGMLLAVTLSACSSGQALFLDAAHGDLLAVKKDLRNNKKGVVRNGSRRSLVEYADPRGLTPLIVATWGDHMDVVKFLVARGATINHKDMYGKTALMWASDDGYTDVVRFLMAHGADPSLIDRNGDTAADLVCKRSNILFSNPCSISEKQTILALLSPPSPPQALNTKHVEEAVLSKILTEMGKRDSGRLKMPIHYHSSVDHPDYQYPEDRRKYAVVIGIGSYRSLPPAEFADRDARDIRNHLIALGYPPRHIWLLVNSNATKEDMTNVLEHWLPEKTGPDSEIFFYFAGHGSPGIHSQKSYLIPWNSNPENLEVSVFSTERLAQDLNRLSARRIFVVLDSCFSGAGGRSFLPKGARPLVIKVAAPAFGSRVTFLAAASADQITTVNEKAGHGTFTYYLLKGLNREKGQVTVRRLFGYLKPKVEDAAQLQNRIQTPNLFNPGNGRF